RSWRESRSLIGERPRVDAWNEKAGHGEEADRLIANQRHVQIARPRSVRVERRIVLEAPARDRAAAQDNPRVGRDLLAQNAKEVVGPLFVAAKREPYDVRPLLRVSQ